MAAERGVPVDSIEPGMHLDLDDAVGADAALGVPAKGARSRERRRLSAGANEGACPRVRLRRMSAYRMSNRSTSAAASAETRLSGEYVRPSAPSPSAESGGKPAAAACVAAAAWSTPEVARVARVARAAGSWAVGTAVEPPAVEDASAAARRLGREEGAVSGGRAHGAGHGNLAPKGERTAAAEHLVQHASESPPVDRRAVAAPDEHLGCNELPCYPELAARLDVRHERSRVEAGQAQMAIGRDDDVLGSYVPVDEAARVHMLEREHELGRIEARLQKRACAAQCHSLREQAPEGARAALLHGRAVKTGEKFVRVRSPRPRARGRGVAAA